MAFENIDTKQLESIAYSLERIANHLENISDTLDHFDQSFFDSLKSAVIAD